MSIAAYTVSFIENHQSVAIRVFHAGSIGDAFNAAVEWNNEQEYPFDYDAIQIQPSWILWQEEARKSA